MRSLLVLSCLILLSSCGSGGDSSSINSIPFSSSENLTAKNPVVSVDYKFTPGMGLLLTKKPGSLGLCTSFLISPTHLMTNSHCVTDISLESDCSKTVGVHIKSVAGQDFRTCKKIITKSTLTSGSFLKPDYAIIEINAPVDHVDPFEISRNGIVAGSELTLESVDFSQSGGNIYGKRKISKCMAQTDSLLGNFTTAMSSIIPLFSDESLYERCKVIHGNSGSPVFDSGNKVVSVVFATVERDRIANSVNVEGKIRDMGLATNIACLKLGIPEFDKSRSENCDAFLEDEKKFQERIQAKVNREYNEKSEKSIKEIKAKLITSMQFDIQKTQVIEDTYRFTPVPTCIVHPNDWDPSEKLKIITDNRTFFKKRSYSTSIPRYSQVLEVSFDDFFRPKVNAVLENVAPYVLDIPDLDKLIKDGSIVATETSQTNAGLPKVTSRTVKLCR